MTPSTHYNIVSAWIDSCITTEQMDSVIDFIINRLITDEKTHDDLVAYWKLKNGHRQWTASKVALSKDWVRLDDEQGIKGDLEYHEPQPTDVC
jgi:hypothetical protein